MKASAGPMTTDVSTAVGAKTCVYVRNIPLNETVGSVEAFLGDIACKNGAADSVSVARRKTQQHNAYTVQHRGRAIIQFATAEGARRAWEALNGLPFAGQVLQADWSKPQQPKSSAIAAPKPHSSNSTADASDKASQHRRRVDRQLEQLQLVLETLPLPPGIASLQAVPHLAEAVKHLPTDLPWVQLPSACDPVSLISSRGTATDTHLPTVSPSSRNSAAEGQMLRPPEADCSEAGEDACCDCCRAGSHPAAARAARKRWQVESFAAVLHLLLPNSPTSSNLSSTSTTQTRVPPQAPCNASPTPSLPANPAPSSPQAPSNCNSTASPLTTDVPASLQAPPNSSPTPSSPQAPPNSNPPPLTPAPSSRKAHSEPSPPPSPSKLHIVDFGCGSGNLLLPLAALFPDCLFTGVDMKPTALRILELRASQAGLTNVTTWQGMIQDYPHTFHICLALHACGNATDQALLLAQRHRAAYAVSPCCVGKLKFSMQGGSNFSATRQTYTPQLPVFLSRMHLQPPATSTAAPPSNSGALPSGNQVEVIEAERQPAEATSGKAAAAHGRELVSPSVDGRAGQATGSLPPAATAAQVVDEGSEQAPTASGLVVEHPRSQWLRQQLQEPEKTFRLLAQCTQVADVSHAPKDSALAQCTQERGELARMAKVVIEMDRNEAARGDGYLVGLFKVLKAEHMAKGELLVGVPAEDKRWAAASARLGLQ